MAFMSKQMKQQIKRRLKMEHQTRPLKTFQCPNCGNIEHGSMSHRKCMNCAPDMIRLDP